jgi:hypothetical protein
VGHRVGMLPKGRFPSDFTHTWSGGYLKIVYGK